MKKRIGILTSGGDCAGLNAVISSVVQASSTKGWEVLGIHNGTDGITETPHSYEELTVHNFSDSPWPRLSGSYLGSLNKGVKMESLEAMSKKFAQGVKDLKLDAVVVVGGDGSMNIVSNYCKGLDVQVVGIPKTIDNDTPVTEFSVGFQTAVQVCTKAIDDLYLTARSHNRAIIMEVMGRDAGHLAMHSALAGAADVCLVPEIPYTIDGIINKLKEVKKSGRNNAIIVVSEGIKTEKGEHVATKKNLVGEAVYGGISQYLTDEISSRYKEFQIRSTTASARANEDTTIGTNSSRTEMIRSTSLQITALSPGAKPFPATSRRPISSMMTVPSSTQERQPFAYAKADSS